MNRSFKLLGGECIYIMYTLHILDGSYQTGHSNSCICLYVTAKHVYICIYSNKSEYRRNS